MLSHLIATVQIDTVVVGTDFVLANGDVTNKIGAYIVAILEYLHNIVFM